MARSTWSAANIPPLDGKLAVVTGANSGLGLETTRALARTGAKVVLACRTASKAEAAIAELVADGIDAARLEFRPCDLSSLDSVRRFAAELCSQAPPIDLLINNAGVMVLPWHETADGFEMQLGTNHFGHFALTGLLLEHLREDARIVTVSSLMHKPGKIRFDDLDGRKRYSAWGAYCQSKLANLLFCFELQRRLSKAGRGQLSLAAHPGYAATNLQAAGPRMRKANITEQLMLLGNRVLAQSAAAGALPSLYAATAPEARGGEFFGPCGIQQMTGPPVRVEALAKAHDLAVARRLWAVSVERTQVDFGGL